MLDLKNIANTLTGVCLALFMAACVSAPINPENALSREKNSCLPVAITMVEALKRQGTQARVVRYSYMRNGKHVGHAVAAYLYPPGENKLWTYDYEGSWRTRAYWGDALGIATAAEKLRARNYDIVFAEFLQ
jgi:hypothetical protein